MPEILELRKSESGAGRSVQSHPLPHVEFKASLGYMRSYLKKKTEGPPVAHGGTFQAGLRGFVAYTKGPE